ncbi:glutathione S-transferase C-terminal domain-containing protein [Streptomyces sp. LP05-1]|uniref:Glutathione S-transferase C-terminal domain-containing protein n=1 Tax=Streptomyces pyxinae TaxID=2970734 RepID=A0ABT2CBR6_9ACTN|nr:glutathione S-transferase C-terminal domain-containing protein [Streptomyces sp. LP05-1]MCS0634854.1 glutathione S-transferase C-terminal domain-containing protein [Streptomyces sp. LP05-1]
MSARTPAPVSGHIPPRTSPFSPGRTPGDGPAGAPAFRGRIGTDARSGHYAVPRRYRLHLSTACPDGLRVAVTHALLGLGDELPVRLLPPTPDLPGNGYSALRPLYEAGAHQYAGPATAPALADDWTGRIVSTHTPDITRDLALRFGGHGPELCPPPARREIAALARRCAGIAAAAQRAGVLGISGPGHDAPLGVLFRALGVLEERLAHRTFALGETVTAADVELWVTLVELDRVHRLHLDAAAVHRLAGHSALWAYARRLAEHPAFGGLLDLDGMARRHHARCRGREAAGAAVPIVDWAVHLPSRPGDLPSPAAHPAGTDRTG